VALEYIDDELFEKYVNSAIDTIGDEYIEKLKNVAIVMADFPSREQLVKVRARPGTTLFGLYEGIPQTKRGAGYANVLPDKITIFKVPILCVVNSEEEFKEQVRKTVWHEIAHHFGMDHKQISDHERRKKI